MKLLVYENSFEEWVQSAHPVHWKKWNEEYTGPLLLPEWLHRFYPCILKNCPYVLR